MRTAGLVAVVAFAAACGGKKSKGGDEVAAGPAVDAPPAAVANAAPAANPATDALWALAPASATIGVVIGEGAGARALAGAMAAEELVRSQPLGAELLDEAASELLPELPPVLRERPHDPATWAKAGIDVTKGAALFVDSRGDQGLAVLPVVDRAKFRDAFGFQTKTLDGVELDVGGDMFCAVVDALYVCAPSAEEVRAVAPEPDGPLAARAAGLPGYLRGDVEIVMDSETLGDGPLGPPHFAGSGTVAITARLVPGALTARLWVEAKPAGPVLPAFGGVPGGLGGRVAAREPTGFMRLRVPVKLLADELPPRLPIGGLETGPLLASLTGELVMYSPSSLRPWLEIALGATDPEPIAKLVDAVCDMIPAAGVKVKDTDGGCTATIPKEMLAAFDPGSAALPVDAIAATLHAGDDRLAIRIEPIGGEEHVGVEHVDSALGAELLAGPWTFALWTSSVGALDYLLSDDQMQLPPELLADRQVMGAVNLARLLFAQVHELGLAGAVRDDGIHGLLHVETYAADGEQVWAAYRAAVAQALAGDGSWGAARERLAAAHPDTRVGRATAAGRSGGLLITVAGIGMGAAIAIPAFMKYIKKSKTTEARQQLRLMYDSAKEAKPKASTPLTPADPTACCEKCAPDAKLWTSPTWIALRFSVDDPHYYSYQYVADPSGAFTVRAHGDLDCDGVWSTFEMSSGGDGLYRDSELE